MAAANTGENSTLATIVKLVKQAQESKAPVVRLADRWASILVCLVLGISAVVWLVTGQVVRAITVLVVFCPCALILATPTAVIAVLGALSLGDTPKPDGLLGVTRLKAMGIEPITMLTGDNERAAASVAAAVGIDTYMARLIPQQKLDAIAKFKSSGVTVAMVGDGRTLTPITGALWHNVGSVAVVLNSARLIRRPQATPVPDAARPETSSL